MMKHDFHSLLVATLLDSENVVDDGKRCCHRGMVVPASADLDGKRNPDKTTTIQPRTKAFECLAEQTTTQHSTTQQYNRAHNSNSNSNSSSSRLRCVD
jgi:hypothetical protein